MILPTEKRVREWVDYVRQLSEPYGPQGAPLDLIADELCVAVRRERSGGTVGPDGYLPGRGMDGGGRGSVRSASSTERAAVALADPSTRLPADPHREHTRAALEALQAAVAALERVKGHLGRLAALGTPTGPLTLHCEACSGHRGVGCDRVADHRSTVGDRLPMLTDLCEACWWYVYRSARAGSGQGELPTPEQCWTHENYQRWRRAA